MFKKLLLLTLAATLSLHIAAAPATAKKAPQANPDETISKVKAAIEAKLGSPVTSVIKTPYLGLYEVYADGQILYTDEKLSAIIAGTLIDGATMNSYTAERM